jgi:hypothetical protein
MNLEIGELPTAGFIFLSCPAVEYAFITFAARLLIFPEAAVRDRKVKDTPSQDSHEKKTVIKLLGCLGWRRLADIPS